MTHPTRLIEKLESRKFEGANIYWTAAIDACIKDIRQHFSDPEIMERVAHAVCPQIKPWMDDESIAPHPCNGCKPTTVTGTIIHGATEYCLNSALNIANKAIAKSGEDCYEEN